MRLPVAWFCSALRLALPAMLWLGGGAGAAIAASGADEWVVAVQLKTKVLADEFPALVDDREIYLPLIRFSALLLIPVVKDNAGNFVGTVSSTGHSFSVNPGAHRLQIDGVGGPLKPADVKLADGEVYVASAVLDKLVPLHIDFDKHALLVEVRGAEPLPIEARWRQEQLRQRILDATTKKVEPTPIKLPYDLFSPPTGDINLTAAPIGNGGATFAYNALLGADVAYLTGKLFVTGDSLVPLRDARVVLGRESPGGDVFGWKPVTEAWAGDVTQPSLPLVGGGSLGRGALISSLPLDRPDDFDKTTIQGDATPGWGVELYQNGLLIAYQVAGGDGRYLFSDVPLFYGTNVFRLALYGPQGQVREETKKVTVGGEMTPPGETLMRAYVGQPGLRTLAPLLPSTSLADGGTAFSYEIEHGVGKTLSTSAYVSRAPISSLIGSDLALSAGVGAQADVGTATVHGDVAVQDPGGYAFDLGAITEIKAVSLSATYSQFERFLSVAASDALQPMTSITTVRAMTSVPSSPLGPLGLQASSIYRTYVDGHNQLTSGVDVLHHIGVVYFDQGFDYVQTGYDTGSPTTRSLVYDTALSAFFNPLWVHAGARINLTSDDPIESLSASVLRRFANDDAGSLAVSYSPPIGRAELDMDYSRQFSFATLSGHASLDSQGEMAIGLGMSFSFGTDRLNKPFMTSRQVAQNGAIAPFVYHDVNANGQFDPGIDEPLPNVAFVGAGGDNRRSKTDSSGDALLTGLSVAEPVVVDVDQTTLKDPFWVSAKGPVVLDPRPGKITPLNIAVVDGGEISGAVLSKADAEPVGGLTLRLIGHDDRVFANVNTLSDGTYLFEAVPPGTYRVEIVSGQVINGIHVAAKSRPAALRPGGTAVDGIDFTIDVGQPKVAGGGDDGGNQATSPAAPDTPQRAGPHFEEANPG